MRTLSFSEAIDDALAQAMASDARIVLLGEDVPLLRRNLLVRFGPERVRGTPISESAFLGAGVAAAMAGLRPVVEVYMADFLGVCIDALLNHAAKVETFSGGKWTAPVVVRAPCGGGYGDGGQHEQARYGAGWLRTLSGWTTRYPAPRRCGLMPAASACTWPPRRRTAVGMAEFSPAAPHDEGQAWQVAEVRALELAVPGRQEPFAPRTDGTISEGRSRAEVARGP